MTPCVLFKDGVTLGDPPTSCQVRILSAYDQGARLLGVPLTVTSGRDAHTTGSHPKGLALDIRTENLSEAQTLTLFNFVRKTLGPDFTVLYERKAKTAGVLGPITTVNANATAPHIHAQLRIGSSFPGVTA